MEEEKLALLLVVEAVEGARFKGVEAIIRGSKNGHALVRVVELILELRDQVAFAEEAKEGAELAAFGQNAGYVDRSLGESLREQNKG